MEKLNIAEILKDCPKGMELYCTMYDNLYFDSVEADYYHTINCYTLIDGIKTTITFTRYGAYNNHTGAKCVIFPKGKTTWEGFQKPFKDGDVVATKSGSWIGITSGGVPSKLIPTYCVITSVNKFEAYFDTKETWSFNRLATEEEKSKLFQAIKDNGYCWNAETKTLEKLPKFKVGDKIQDVDCYKVQITAVNKEDEFYEYSSIIAKGLGAIPFKEQNNWELVSNKFDITTLVPFESKVLVRNFDSDYWKPAIFGFAGKDKNAPFCVEGGNFFNKCIPYEGNEHLLSTREDCNEYYKNW